MGDNPVIQIQKEGTVHIKLSGTHKLFGNAVNEIIEPAVAVRISNEETIIDTDDADSPELDQKLQHLLLAGIEIPAALTLAGVRTAFIAWIDVEPHSDPGWVSVDSIM